MSERLSGSFPVRSLQILTCGFIMVVSVTRYYVLRVSLVLPIHLFIIGIHIEDSYFSCRGDGLSCVIVFVAHYYYLMGEMNMDSSKDQQE